MREALNVGVLLVGMWLITGTLLNFSKRGHWYIRGWDFPRVFELLLAVALAGVHALLVREWAWYHWLFQAGLWFVMGRQVRLIFPYTPLGRKTVKCVQKAREGAGIRVLISNVLMENEAHELWLDVVRRADADVIVALEVDEKWAIAIDALREHYPHVLRQPQDNYYGMMLLSRLKLSGTQVEYLVQRDIPSMHVTVHLVGGETVRLHALHPRPPEPLRDQSSGPRDAELVIMAKQIGEQEPDGPTIVCGDLNDVAWSYTTMLFLRLSGLLDPRMGRGMFNSYNAKSRIFRFPLDHVFHSNEFKLVELRICDYVGSDHFPVLIELSLEPHAEAEQPEPRQHEADQEQAAEIVEREVEAEIKGEEKGHVSGRRH